MFSSLYIMRRKCYMSEIILVSSHYKDFSIHQPKGELNSWQFPALDKVKLPTFRHFHSCGHPYLWNIYSVVQTHPPGQLWHRAFLAEQDPLFVITNVTTLQHTTVALILTGCLVTEPQLSTWLKPKPITLSESSLVHITNYFSKIKFNNILQSSASST